MMMRRFRPIAPKPSDGLADLEKRNVGLIRRRSKRKYVRKSSSGGGGQEKADDGVVTLQLLPEDRSDETQKKKKSSRVLISSSSEELELVMSSSYRSSSSSSSSLSSSSGVVTNTWITLECITQIYTGLGLGLGLGLLGVSDRDKISCLEADTCPAFVSDASNNLLWVNQAYTSLLPSSSTTSLLLKHHKLPYFAPSFACTLTLIHQTKHGHKWSRIVPCDVWRMDFPGFAWKLDVNTALGLRI